jgi:ABC-type transporter Mla subunit MlaD
MDERQKYFRLGLFVFVSFTIVAGILFVLGGRSLFEPTMTFETYFNESVAGLDIGAPVRFRGVPMGQVTEIVLSMTEYEPQTSYDKRRSYIIVRAKVTLPRDQIERLGRETHDLVKSGLRVQSQLAGITGQQFLALDILDPEKYPPLPFDWTPKYPYIPSAPSATGEVIAGVQSFLASLNKADVHALGRNLNAFVANLNSKVSEVPAAELSTEALAVLKDVRATVDRADGLLSKPDVDAALHNFALASGHLDGLLADPGLKQALDNIVEISARLRKLVSSGDIDRTARSLDAAAARLSLVIGDNQFDVRVIVQDLRVTADNLRVLSETIKRNPAGALLGGPPKKVQLPGESP